MCPVRSVTYVSGRSLLNPLLLRSRFGRIWAQLGATSLSSWAQQRRYSFDCVASILADYVRIHSERDARISVPQLLLHNFRRGSGVQKQTCVRVPEGVKSAARNFQCVQHGPQAVLDNLVR